jgi:hypothetical protein
MDTLYYQSAANATVAATPTVATTSVLLIDTNLHRKGLLIYNNSANTIYIAYSTTASSATKMTLPIATFATWNMPLPIYTGPIAGIRNSGSGTCMVTELT